MIVRLGAVVCLALFPFLPLRAEEVALTYGRAPDRPVMYESFELYEEEEDLWEKGADLLTDKAVTLCAYFPIAGLEDGLILSFDNTAAGAAKFDTLYADVDFDLCLGKGEKFPLELARMPGDDYPPGTELPLCAARLSLEGVAGGGKAPFFVNIYVIPVPDAGDGLMLLPLWYEAWGCCRGAISFGSAAFDLILRDQNVNGSFTDFEQHDGKVGDTLTLVPAKSAGSGGRPPWAQPLREKMLLGGRTFLVKVKENGRKLLLDPHAVKFGRAAAPGEEMEVALTSPVWGTHTVGAGSTLALPAGDWKVHSFRQIDRKTGAFCRYMGPEGITLTLAEGAAARVPDLELEMTPAVTMRGKGRRSRTLSLVLSTSQGARFKEYGNPAAAEPLPGIPLRITDGSGRTVTEGYFPFG